MIVFLVVLICCSAPCYNAYQEAGRLDVYSQLMGGEITRLTREGSALKERLRMLILAILMGSVLPVSAQLEHWSQGNKTYVRGKNNGVPIDVVYTDMGNGTSLVQGWYNGRKVNQFVQSNQVPRARRQVIPGANYIPAKPGVYTAPVYNRNRPPRRWR